MNQRRRKQLLTGLLVESFLMHPRKTENLTDQTGIYNKPTSRFLAQAELLDPAQTVSKLARRQPPTMINELFSDYNRWDPGQFWICLSLLFIWRVFTAGI